jgi:hypothetical protein
MARRRWREFSAAAETASKVAAVSAVLVGGTFALYQSHEKSRQDRVAQSIKLYEALRQNPSYIAVKKRIIAGREEGTRLAKAATDIAGVRAYGDYTKQVVLGTNEHEFWEVLEQYQIASTCIRESLCDCRSYLAFTGEEAQRLRIWFASSITDQKAVRNDPSVAEGLTYLVKTFNDGCDGSGVSKKEDAVQPHWTEIAKLTVSIAGFFVVIVQLLYVLKALRSNTYAKLYDQYLRLNEMFLQRPHLRRHFYASFPAVTSAPEAAASSASVEQQLEIDAMSEMLAGLLEHAELQRENLPDKNCWEAYTLARFRDSAQLRQFISDHRGWYAKALHDLLKRSEVTLPAPRERLG